MLPHSHSESVHRGHRHQGKTQQRSPSELQWPSDGCLSDARLRPGIPLRSKAPSPEASRHQPAPAAACAQFSGPPPRARAPRSRSGTARDASCRRSAKSTIMAQAPRPGRPYEHALRGSCAHRRRASAARRRARHPTVFSVSRAGHPGAMAGVCFAASRSSCCE